MHALFAMNLALKANVVHNQHWFGYGQIRPTQDATDRVTAKEWLEAHRKLKESYGFPPKMEGRKVRASVSVEIHT